MSLIIQRPIEIYVTREGKSPFVEWLDSLQDKTIRYRIKERLDRVSLGNLGDHKTIGNGIVELRFSFGGGYRIYFGQIHNKTVLLLCGGDKSSQQKDITKAKKYWKDYLSR